MADLTEVGDLVVEDGTGLANANSYINIAFADDYHNLRNHEGNWADATESDKVTALIQATDYVDKRFRYVGLPLTETQALAWPRIDAVDRDGIDQSSKVPEVVKKATAEYALRALTAPLLPDPTADESGSQIVRKREKVGPIEEETEFSDRRSRVVIKLYPSADRLLLNSGLVTGTSSAAVRA